MGIEALRIYLNGSNLFMLDKAKIVDRNQILVDLGYLIRCKEFESRFYLNFLTLI